MNNLVLDHGTTSHGINWVQLLIPDLNQWPNRIEAKIVCQKIRFQFSADPSEQPKIHVVRTKILAKESEGLQSNTILDDQDMASGLYHYSLVIQTRRNVQKTKAKSEVAF